MEKGNSYHAHVSYPDCRIFLSYILRIRHQKTQCFHIFHHISIFCTTFLYFVPHFYDNLVSKAIQKYLYKGCNFYPVLSCVQKLKFHHAPKDIGCWKFAYLKFLFKFSDEKFVELFQFFIIKPPSAPSDKGLEHTIRKPLCMGKI